MSYSENCRIFQTIAPFWILLYLVNFVFFKINENCLLNIFTQYFNWEIIESFTYFFIHAYCLLAPISNILKKFVSRRSNNKLEHQVASSASDIIQISRTHIMGWISRKT